MFPLSTTNNERERERERGRERERAMRQKSGLIGILVFEEKKILEVFSITEVTS